MLVLSYLFRDILLQHERRNPPRAGRFSGLKKQMSSSVADRRLFNPWPGHTRRCGS